MKTMRETLMEKKKNLLNNFLEDQAYHLSQNSFHDQKFLSQPLKNLMDVSLLGGWLSSQRPLVIWPSTVVLPEVAGGMLGLGLLQEAETVGNKDPIPRGEGTLILYSWAVLAGPRTIS